jgi:uncharacterized protein YecE (DUF72 family)
MAKAYIGTSGWNYKHWSKGEFYPEHLKQAEWLSFFAGRFHTVEINNSFYHLPSETAFQHWRTQVPPEFLFAVKASRFLTHIKRLRDPEDPLDLFFSHAKHLKNRLGPVLFQLPPRFKVNLERLEIFLSALKPYITKMRIRCVMEFRDASWLAPPVFALMRRHGVAVCLADWREMPVRGPLTADFVYVRRHYGDANRGNYSRTALNADVAQIGAWLSDGLDVYMYFNNDMEGHAIRNAMYVQRTLANAGSGKRKQAGGSARRRGFLKSS